MCLIIIVIIEGFFPPSFFTALLSGGDVTLSKSRSHDKVGILSKQGQGERGVMEIGKGSFLKVSLDWQILVAPAKNNSSRAVTHVCFSDVEFW